MSWREKFRCRSTTEAEVRREASAPWSLSLSHSPGSYLSLPKHHPVLHLLPRPSFSLLNQEHPGEFPRKMVHRHQPSLFSSSISSEASSTQTVPGTAPGITCAASFHRPHPSSSLRLPCAWRSISIHTQTPRALPSPFSAFT